MSEGRRILPEWRWWPAIPLGALFAIAVLGFIYQPKDEQQYPTSQSSQSDVDHRTADDRIADYTLWLERLTGLLAISTLGLWFVTWQTLRHSQSDAARQAQDMRASIAAAQAVATAAALSAQVADTSMKLGQRAFIDMAYQNSGVATNTELFGIKGDWFIIQGVFMNSGITRALAVNLYAESIDVPKGATPVFDYFGMLPGGAPLGPKMPCKTDYVGFLKETVVSAINGEVDLFALFRVEYNDVFSNIRRHTQYCVKVEPRVRDIERIFAKGTDKSEMWGPAVYSVLCSSS